MARKKKKKALFGYKTLIFVLGLLLLVLLGIFILLSQDPDNDKRTIIADKLDLEKIKEEYSDYVVALDEASLYEIGDKGKQKVSTIRGKIELRLDPNYEIVDEYYKLLDSEYYVRFDQLEKIAVLQSKEGEYKYYKNYVPFNESVVLKDLARLYVDDNNYYEVSGGSYPIVIKEEEKYGIEYNHRLVYVLSSDVLNVVASVNTDKEYDEEIGVLNYHFVVSSSNENGERSECQQSICITDEMFERHVQYLKDNGYYAATLRDLELFIDGKVQLPINSVVLTFDDGWYVARTKQILEKYQMMGTLFLIGSLASPNDYVSEYLEIHSHTWDMHKLGVCPASVGRGGILCLDDQTILEDLKRSRESLGNTPYFCYPFYDYNERAIRLVKEAGFTMAFVGQNRDSKVRVGQDKYKIPRYVIVNTTTMSQFISYIS